jgi:hypothetical protein
MQISLASGAKIAQFFNETTLRGQFRHTLPAFYDFYVGEVMEPSNYISFWRLSLLLPVWRKSKFG